MMSSVVCNGALWGIHRYNKDIGSKGNHMIQNSEGGSATQLGLCDSLNLYFLCIVMDVPECFIMHYQ